MSFQSSDQTHHRSFVATAQVAGYYRRDGQPHVGSGTLSASRLWSSSVGFNSALPSIYLNFKIQAMATSLKEPSRVCPSPELTEAGHWDWAQVTVLAC